jgi:hypothetical protein
MVDATLGRLSPVFVLQRGALLVGGLVLVFACGGPSFSGEKTVAGAGSGGSSGAGITSGASHGGDGVTEGGADVGGKAAGGKASGGGATNGGHGGLVSVAGSAGRAGGGGSGGAAGNGGSGGALVETPPVPLDGLELWFKAEAGVTEVSGVVAKWEDASGHARHALQTATNLRPKLDAKGLNGKPALVFDGADDYLKLPTLPGNFEKGLTAFVIAQQDSDDGSCFGFFEASNGPEIDDIHVGAWQGAMQYEVADEYLHPTDYPLLVGKPELIAVVHQASTAVQLRRNSSSLGDDQFALPITKEREQVYIAHTAYSDCHALSGRIGEILLYSRAVSDDELIGIETYLQKKWACCSE